MESLSALFSKHFFVVLWISALTIFGAIAGYIKKLKDGTIERFRISELVGDIVISFFLGVVTYLLCKGVGVNEYLSAGLVGFVSHLGTKGITMLENFIPQIISKWFGLK